MKLEKKLVSIHKPEYQDTLLLKALLTRAVYEASRERIPEHTLARESKAILAEIDKVYTKSPELEEIAPETLKSSFKLYPNMDTKNKEIYCAIIDSIEDEPLEQVDVIVQRMMEQYAWEKIERIYRSEGLNTEKIEAELLQFTQQSEQHCDVEKEQEWDWEDLQTPVVGQGKYKWSLSFLNEYLKPPEYGRFYVVAAGPNNGKTAFVANEAVHLASQLPEGERILWLNNEEERSDVINRWRVRTCGAPLSKLIEWPERAKEKYLEVMKGDKDKIRYIDTRQCTFDQLKQLLDSRKWSMIVVDMIDNISLPKHMTKTVARDDQKLELLYNFFRSYAYVNGNGPVIATSQCNGTSWVDHEGQQQHMKIVGMKQLHGTNVAKQGATDTIITIGMQNEKSPIRYVNIAKDKGPGNSKWIQCRLEAEVFKYED